MFIRHRTAENNQRNLSHGFKNILFGDNMHYVDLYSCICIGVFGKSGTTKIWGGAFAPPAPLATPLGTTESLKNIFDSSYETVGPYKKCGRSVLLYGILFT